MALGLPGSVLTPYPSQVLDGGVYSYYLAALSNLAQIPTHCWDESQGLEERVKVSA